MTVRIGYHGPGGDGSRHFHLFEFRKINPGEGRCIIIGYHRFSYAELIDLREKGARMRLWALGVISFTPDVSPALIEDVFESFTVHGQLRNRPQRQTATPVRS